jgi:hypothetical protein
LSNKTRLANTFIALMVAAAVATIACAAEQAQAWHLYQGLILLLLAGVTSRMKVTLPGLTGNMSVNLPFLLLAVAELNPLEALIVACVSTIVQTLPSNGQEFKPVRMLFNVSMMAVACGLAGFVSHHAGETANWVSGSASLIALSASVFFLGQTVPVAAIITLTEGSSWRRVWMSIAQLSFPYFALSAALTGSIVASSGHPGWLPSLLAWPVMAGVYWSFTLYFRTRVEPAPQAPLAMRAAAGR